jgi:cytochrome P450
MLRQPHCMATLVLQRLQASEKVRQIIDGANGDAPASAQTFSTAAFEALDCAIDEATGLKANFIGTEHVLLAILRQPDPLKGQLAAAGVDYDSARAELLDLYYYGTGPRSSPPRRILLLARHYLTRAVRYGKIAYAVSMRGSIVDPRLKTNPYPAYRRMLGKGIRRDPVANMWVATRYADAVSILRDPRFIRRGPTYHFANPESHHRLPPEVRKRIAIASEFYPRQMLFENPPSHTRLRGLVSGAFTPAYVERLRGRIQAIADSLLDTVASRDRIDLINDFAYPLPLLVISEMLGIPADDYEKLKAWSDDVAELLMPRTPLATARKTCASLSALREFFNGVLSDLRREPRNNLLSALLAAEAQGEKLSPEELFANSVLLLAAGHETTTNLIGNGLLALLKHPDQLEYLRKNPDSMPSAIEEFLRYDSPVQWTSRLAGEDLELQGHQIRRNDLILIGLASANRDPEQFSEPDKLDVTRKENRHIAFGHGIHFCLGAALARMEGEIAFTALLRRFPRMRVESRGIQWRSSIFLRGMKSMPIVIRD